MTNSEIETIDVSLQDRTYPIHIGPGVLGRRDLFADIIGASDVLVVSDTTVAEYYLGPLVETLAPSRVETLVLDAGEKHKTLEALSQIIDHLAENAFHRDAVVVALGGGVVGDIAGFAAACYQRGIAYIQVPTTLLAQVDASVGGKTAVNHPAGKNLIGAFHQPRAVLADVSSLDTLDPRQYRSGIAEVVKYGVGLDTGFFDWLEMNMASLVAREPAVLTETVRRCCLIKAGVVADDEFEAGRRALLNLGHTFGHAIEVASGYGEWLHGEAVAVGIVMATRLSAGMGLVSDELVERVSNLLRSADLPVSPPRIGVARMVELMGMDKKVAAGRARFVILDALGVARLSDDVPSAVLHKTLFDSGVESG
ncbi:MAG: 3-dehydroquinate synthase [Gammaproteobacteria bacterium]